MKTTCTSLLILLASISVLAQVPKQHYFIVPGTMSYRLDATANPALSHPDTLVRGKYYGAAGTGNSNGAMTGYNSSQYKDFSLFFHRTKANFITSPQQVDVLPRTQNGGYNWSSWLINYRIAYPTAYDSVAESSEKFPLIVFMHGAGERGVCWGNRCYQTDDPRMWNNDHNVSHGGKQHLTAINSNPSDPRHWPGFVVFPQNKNGYNPGEGINTYTGRVIALVEKLAESYPIDKNRIYIHGLSEGAQGAWMLINSRPDLFAASAPMSGIKDYGAFSSDPVAMDTTMIHIPLWQFQGGTDNKPKPSATEGKMAKLRNLGGTPRYTLYPNIGHAVWNTAYNEPDFFSWFLQYSKLTIHGYFGIREVCEGDEVNVRLGISKGFDDYEWRKIKNGNITAMPPSPERANEIIADELASYQVRFARGTEWTEWSEPYEITSRPRPTAEVTANGSTALPGLDGRTEVTLSTNQPGIFYTWYRNGDLYLEDSTLNQITVSTPGQYSLIVKDEGHCSGNESNIMYVSNTPYSGTLPAAPTNLDASSNSASSINIYWEDRSTDELGFEVYRSTDGNTFTWVTTTLPDQLMYTDTALSNQTEYFYKVRAYNINGPSEPSNVASAVTATDNEKPSAPGDFKFENFAYTEYRLNVDGNNLADEHFEVHTDQVVLSWLTSTDNVDIKEYKVYYEDGTLAGTTTNTTITISGLTKEEVYGFYVVAEDLAGNISNPSNSISVTTVMEGLYFHLFGGGTWDVIRDFSDWPLEAKGTYPNFKLAAKDGIYDQDDDYFAFDFFGYIHITAAGTYTFYTTSDDGSQLWIGDQLVVENDGLHGMIERSGSIDLAVGAHPITVKYFERSGGEGLEVRYQALGIPKQLIPDIALKSGVSPTHDALEAPFDLVATAHNTEFSIDLIWDYVASTPTPKFEVYASTGEGFQIVHTTASGETSFQHTDLKPDQDYTYKLKAVNMYGSSVFSETASATTIDDQIAPTVPQNLTMRSRSNTKIALSWDPSEDNVGVVSYIVSYDLASEDNSSRVGSSTSRTAASTATTSTNAITIEELEPETAYTFTVAAVDASGNESEYSDPLTVETTSDNPLPVEFKDLTYSIDKVNVILEWGTASEVNNDYFSIERAVDLSEFVSIGEINGAGTTTEAQEYSYTDAKPLNIAYYRIKQVDFDGYSSYSNVVRVTLKNIFEDLTIYPNPTTHGNINIKGYVPSEKSEIQIGFYDTMGKEIFAIATDPNSLLQGFHVSTTNYLNPGVYVIIIKDGTHQSQKRLIIR